VLQIQKGGPLLAGEDDAIILKHKENGVRKFRRTDDTLDLSTQFTFTAHLTNIYIYSDAKD